MNFFGHYYLDHKPSEYWYNIGLIYPDLFRDLFKHKAPSIQLDTKIIGSEHHAFISGINQHLKTDALFHHHVFFHAAQEFVKQKMDSLEMTKMIPRSFFAIHVLTELLIDRQLVAKFPAIATQMHNDMESVLENALIVNKLFAKTQYADIFLNRLTRIHADKFIFAYTNNQKLIATLYAIYSKMNIQFMPSQIKKLAHCWDPFINELEKDNIFNIEQFKHEKVQ